MKAEPLRPHLARSTVLLPSQRCAPTPTLTAGPPPSSGLVHTCVLFSNATVKCFGVSGEGQFPPDDVGGPVASLFTAPRSDCVILTTGKARCFGYYENTYGQMTIPAYLVNEDVSSIAMAYQHTCFLLASGAVRCWGRDDFKQSSGLKTNKTCALAVSAGEAMRLDAA